jgi:pimeloyl-ACP methyl ester carboxylesterase
MIRLCSYLWPFTSGVRLGWLTADHPNPDGEKMRDRIFFFRGQGIVFSNGFGTLCSALRRAGYWAEDLRCVGHRWVCRELTRTIAPSRGRVIFVGHSAGGRYALVAAQQLQKIGVTIDRIVCLDVALPDPVPANVLMATHLYFTRRRLYPARPLTLALGSTAHLENVDLDAGNSPISARWLTHLNITDSPTIQGLVLQRIQQTLDTRSRIGHDLS